MLKAFYRFYDFVYSESKKSEMNQATDQDPKKQLMKGVVNPAYG